MALIDLGQGPGHALYTGTLCRALREGGLEFALIRQSCLPAAPYGPVSQCLELEAPVGWSSGLVRLLAQPAALWRLRRFLRKFNPDLIHWVFPHPWMLIPPGLLGPWPWVSTLHDPQLHPGEDGALSREIQRAVLRRSSALLVLGEAMLRSAQDLFPEFASKLIASPHGHFNDQWTELPKIDLASRTFLLFGRLSLYKGLRRALAAFALLQSRWPDSRLIIAGHGAARALSQLAPTPSGLELREGIQSELALRALLAESLAVLVPYEQASASGVLITAAAMGRAAVASDLPALRELIVPGETGWLVDSQDPAQLAEAMAALLKNPELAREAGARARAGMAARQPLALVAAAHRQAYALAAQNNFFSNI